MKSTATKPGGVPEADPEQPKVDAVCLLPMPTMSLSVDGDDPPLLEHRLALLHRNFGRRFTYGYYVSTERGLLRIDDVSGPEPKSFIDLGVNERHVYINALRGQVSVLMEHGRPALCLLASYYAQYMRRLDLPFSMPLAGMSRRQRRSWLEHAVTESTDALLNRLFGRPVVYGQSSGSRPTQAEHCGV